MTARSPGGRLTALLLTVGLALIALLGLGGGTAFADSSDTTARIDHSEPQGSGLAMLVYLPGTDAVDLSSVRVQVKGEAVRSKAALAMDSNTVQRTTVLALDTSNSMKGRRIREAIKAARVYLATVPANVKVGIVSFDDRVRTLLTPSLDRAAARKMLGKIKLARNTVLYSGVRRAVELTGRGGDQAGGQRSVLVLSDGRDTTGADLSRLLSEVQSSGVKVDAVSLQQRGTNGSLGAIAGAGRGSLLNANDPSALSAAFAQEAALLTRQVLVESALPKGTHGSGDVVVSLRAGSQTYLAKAYVVLTDPKAEQKQKVAAESAAPVPVSGGLNLPLPLVLLAALSMGVAMVVIVAGVTQPSAQKARGKALARQLEVYGGQGVGSGHQEKETLGLADQARLAAERALQNNRTAEARIAARLEGAGMSLKPAEWLLLHAAIAILSAFVGFVLGAGSLAGAVIFLLVGAVGPWVFLGLKRSRRLKAFDSALADNLQLMSGSLSAGLSLAQSIDTIVREGSEPTASEFKRVVVESRLGVTLEDAMEGVSQRMESRDFGWVVMAIRIQRDVGGNLAELLLTVAATLREREYLRRHVKALSAEGRLSGYILGGLPPGFAAYLILTKPEYMHPMLSSPIGFLMIGTIVLLLSVGIFWMMKVAKVDI